MASTANIKSEIITQLNFLPEKSLESDFFKICGIWQERDIDSNSLRRKAWREIKW